MVRFIINFRLEKFQQNSKNVFTARKLFVGVVVFAAVAATPELTNLCESRANFFRLLSVKNPG